jgi:hypothetical protein
LLFVRCKIDILGARLVAAAAVVVCVAGLVLDVWTDGGAGPDRTAAKVKVERCAPWLGEVAGDGVHGRVRNHDPGWGLHATAFDSNTTTVPNISPRWVVADHKRNRSIKTGFDAWMRRTNDSRNDIEVHCSHL